MKKERKMKTQTLKMPLLTSLMILIVNTAFAQEPVQIHGKFEREFIQPIKLFAVVEGEMEEIASTLPQSNKKFGFTFYPEYEGFYAIGTGGTGYPTYKNIFYFKPGDQLEFTTTDVNYQLTGTNNSKENQILQSWHELINPIAQKSYYIETVYSTFIDFFPELETTVPKADDFVKSNKSGNAKFDARLPEYIKWDLAAHATNFLQTPRSAHPSLEEYPDYYKSLQLVDFAKNASTVYKMPWGKRSLGSISWIAQQMANIPLGPGIEYLEKRMNLLPNDTLKGDVVLEYLGEQRTLETYKEAADKFAPYFLTARQKAKATAIQVKLAELEEGGDGFNFSFPDNNGDIVNFDDLKGKVVLIDVWATWCGPCRDEIPHLKKLEEEMQGTDVQVVSISTDDEKNKEKWQKMIKDEQLGGLQLLAPQRGDDFLNYYKIYGIPRFLVFDRDGKIVSTNAPRPSDPKLKQLLNDILARK